MEVVYCCIDTRTRQYVGYYTTLDSNYWSCTSSHTDLSQCPYSVHSSCFYGNDWWDMFDIICYSPIIGKELLIVETVVQFRLLGTACTDGDVRLVGGSDSSEGRIEYCYESNWYPVCSLTSYAASLMCQHLGFNSSRELILNDHV